MSEPSALVETNIIVAVTVIFDSYLTVTLLTHHCWNSTQASLLYQMHCVINHTLDKLSWG